MGTYQDVDPVVVFNGDIQPYQVKSRLNTDGSYSQLVGIDPANLDAFSRLRVSSPVTLFEAMFRYDLHPQWFETKVASSGTVVHSPGTASAILSTSTGNGSEAILQSRQYIPYQPGKSQLVALTWHFGTAVANVRRRAGYFDATDGVYLEQTTDGLTINLRSSVTGASLRSVAQADWNLDPLDGSGPSGITLDIEVAQILLIDFQFLGVGQVRCAFDIDGQIVPFHAFQNANRLDLQPYMITASLPIRYEITNTAASVGASLDAICCQVMSEGGSAAGIGYEFSAANLADVNTSTTRAHLISIRPQALFPPTTGVAPRGVIIPLDLSAIVGGANAIIEVWYNPVYSGGTWTSRDDNSFVEFSTNATFSATGIPIDKFFVATGAGAARSAATQNISTQYPLVLDIAGANPRALMLTVTALAATGTARAAVNWREIR